MIIAVYGIPRSGKDTFISEITKTKTKAIHLKGSSTLNNLSYEKYGKSFKELSSLEQKEIRVAFTEYAKVIEKDYELVIVDGHYAFPNSESFEIVFTHEDLMLYDAFFYLNRTPEEIERNFKNDSKINYKEILLDKNRIKSWIDFEIENMKIEVESIEKDFIVLDSNPLAVQYVLNFKRTSKEIAESIASDIIESTSKKCLVLADLDKTISINDLTNDFIENSGLDPSYPKTIFKGDFYTTYQFSLFHNYLAQSQNYDSSIEYALKKLVLNKELINDLYSLKNEYFLIGISTGMADAWDKKNLELDLFDMVFGNRKNKSLIVTPLIKKIVSRILTEKYHTIGIGDSIIDLGMLLASNKGYLISMTKLDKRIIKAKDNGLINKELYQFPYSNFKYDFIKEEKIK